MYSLVFLGFSILMFFLSMMFNVMDLVLILEFHLFSVNSSSVVMTILLDWMSFLFMSFVLYISSMVILYSGDYMFGDLNIKRFILLVVMFVLSMMLLIISPNLISILLGWDGLGLVSYCLVIYYQNIKSYNAGMLTALSNRIGDVFLLLSIAWMLNYGSWNYYYYLDFYKEDSVMKIITFMVFMAALTKSAQIPFSSWLPAAMAAPTPVSSLVHSSTLVTAGIYLLIRFSFALNTVVLLLLLFIGTMTMFMAGLGANFEFDLKKIIALSTLSQLGLMMSILALGEWELSFFHLLTHALFKATLFMCAGCMIHNLNNCQDIRFMGSLIFSMPLTCSIFLISNLALCGLPFLSGFYSKDLILEILSLNYLNIYIYLIFFISTGLTVSYTFRLIYYVLLGNFNFISLNSLNESSFLMLSGMMGLIFFVIMGGSLLMWLIFPVPYFICLPLIMKMMALIVSIIGMGLGVLMSQISLSSKLMSLFYYKISLFLALMWNMPVLSTLGLNYSCLYLGKMYYKVFDQGWSEYFGGQNMYLLIKMNSMKLHFIFSQKLKILLLLLVIWMMVLLLMFF
uniref:NADH-ubiquinone oxidoreductase chain 5 n=1 Tax=Scaphidium quadrimaculatum TaxID=295644 RepID=A0A0S2M844_SCAQU|nr:NADH dehydrogenase subunit 5 [Scaphidium quadrimaculatum]ALO70880.1 NADH deshydrogenase subunit 5 [Scaphidium quadrimaculatum]